MLCVAKYLILFGLFNFTHVFIYFTGNESLLLKGNKVPGIFPIIVEVFRKINKIKSTNKSPFVVLTLRMLVKNSFNKYGTRIY